MLLRHCKNTCDRNKLNTVLFCFTSRYTDLHVIGIRRRDENVKDKTLPNISESKTLKLFLIDRATRYIK